MDCGNHDAVLDAKFENDIEILYNTTRCRSHNFAYRYDKSHFNAISL